MSFARILLAWLTLASTAAALDNVIVLVRHAEKVDDSRDAELSETGRVRAEVLAALLKDMKIDTIFSSDYIRTRETARPLAEALGLELELYNPRDLEALATKLRAAEGRVLVVGHSNTTRRLVGLIGGEPGTDIADDEYDRLYIVVAGSGGPVTSLLRFSP